jgi:hypothetical protein
MFATMINEIMKKKILNMHIKIIHLSFIFVACLSSTPAHPEKRFDSQAFADCIISGMKGISSDEAAKAIVSACTIKFTPSGGKDEKSASSDRVKCGKKEFGRYEFKSIEFPVPNEFGDLKIVNIIWQNNIDTRYESQLWTYIEHNFPFEIQGFYLQGFNDKGVEDASYYCHGRVGAGAVGLGRCAHVQESSKTFSVKAILSSPENVLDLAKRLKIC